jgi:DNA-binding MarR family transcriptional regulator
MVAAKEVRQRAVKDFGLSCELIPVKPFEMSDILGKALAVGKRLQDADYRVTVNLTGGTNVMAGAALVACFMLGSEAVYIREDVTTRKDEPLEDRLIRLPIPKVALKDVSEPHRKVLRELAKEPGGRLENAVTALRERFGTSAQTASNRLKKLRSMGLVVLTVDEKDERSRIASLTDTGRLFAQMSR